MRDVAVEDFCTAPGQNALRPGELLASLRFPPPAARTGAYYLRFTPRKEMDIAVAGAGVSVELENGVFRSVRIALAAVAPTPLFVRDAGVVLAVMPVDDGRSQSAWERDRQPATATADMRGNQAAS